MRTSALLLLLAVGASLAQTDRRIARTDAQATGHRLALAIGNQSYGKRPLTNPVHDAEDLERTLKSDLGFETTLLTDADLPTMERTINRFTSSVRPGDVALIYYSGHGMEVGGENYLLPVDFSASDEVDVKYKAYPASRLRDRLHASGAGLIIVILDACRDNPFRSWKSESGGGLAAMSGAGAFIAFAADQGKTADDNPGQRNGLFTKHLLAALQERGLTIDEVFNQVRQNVYKDSGGRQTPFVYTGLIGSFRFREAPVAAPAAAPASVPPAVDLDLELFTAVKESRDPAQLEAAAGRLHRADLAGILKDRAAAMRSAAGAAPASAPKTDAVTPAESLPAAPHAGAASDKEQTLTRADSAYLHKDYATAFNEYSKLANAGDPWGMSRLGQMYRDGNGVARDCTQAIGWLRKSADAGDVSSMNSVGVLYSTGSCVKQDWAEAVTWYRKAADAGDAVAMGNLGARYELGQGVAQDYTQAAFWFKKAVEAGSTRVSRNLGNIYSNGGHGLQQDYAEAANWYRKSAEAGDASAMNSLGAMYNSGHGVAQDYAQAADWYRKSAEAGSGAAMSNLGSLYFNGYGVAKDYKQALNWYQKGADRNNPRAMRDLGVLYMRGLGVVKDYVQGLSWIRKAAEAGDELAMNDLGNYYETGMGVHKSVDEAVAWYRKAADKGQEEAKASLKRLHR